jgi:hypothetical protein
VHCLIEQGFALKNVTFSKNQQIRRLIRMSSFSRSNMEMSLTSFKASITISAGGDSALSAMRL